MPLGVTGRAHFCEIDGRVPGGKQFGMLFGVLLGVLLGVLETAGTGAFLPD